MYDFVQLISAEAGMHSDYFSTEKKTHALNFPYKPYQKWVVFS